ncbi:MAG TPA: hypothetical protein DCM38_12255 [Gammaproteobacteria bacterium]|nr:hypothetical protein [Gammaproteobacteria bacterium]
MNWISKLAHGFKHLFGIKPTRIGIVGYPGIGKTVYLTILYGICGVLRKCEKMKVMAGKSQQYFHSKWNQITGVERQFLRGTEHATQFDFKMTLNPDRAFRSQTRRIEFVDPPGEALTVNPQAEAEEVNKVDAFLDEVDALLFLIEPDDFDFVALAVKLKALLESVAQDQAAFEQDKKAFITQHCDHLQIKLLPEQGSASLTTLIAVITDFMAHADENRAVETLVALYKQDAVDRAVAHLNRIGERLDRPINIAVVVTKADKLLPFQETRSRPTVLIPDQLRQYRNIKENDVDKLIHALSQYWGIRDDRWPPIIQQLFGMYEHFFNDLSRVKGDYQIFFVSAIGDVDWDQEQHKTRPPRTIRPQGIENPVEWCIRKMMHQQIQINMFGIAKHFLIFLLLGLMIWPLQRFNNEIGPALEKAERLNDVAHWKTEATQWWTTGNREVQRRYELQQLQVYWRLFTDLQHRLKEDEQMRAALNALGTTVNQLEITEARTRQIKKTLQGAIYEAHIWLNVKSDYTDLRNRLDPHFHYQRDCCLSDANSCQETLAFSQQVSLQAIQYSVNQIRDALPPHPRMKKLVCFKQNLNHAAGQISKWSKKGMWLKFQLPLAWNQLDPKRVVLLGSDEIQSGDDIKWLPNEKRDFKFLALDSADNIIYQTVYQEPYEFVNNICWTDSLNLTVRPFFEIYLEKIGALFPPLDQNHCL